MHRKKPKEGGPRKEGITGVQRPWGGSKPGVANKYPRPGTLEVEREKRRTRWQ